MKEKRRKRQPEEIHEKEVSSADEKSSSAKERGRKKKRKGRTGVTILLFVILAVGAGVLIYPTFSNWWNSFHQTRAIAGYVDTVDDMGEEEAAKLLAEAEAWNQALLSKPDRYHLTDEQRAAYDSILDITGTGIMGYIDIPSIDVSLPIYHGTSESVLQIAIGHLEWSSFPVGGVGTHAALSGHRGLPSARLFTDIDQLKEGDHFLIQVLTRTLTYEVDQIRTVLPQEMSDLELDATEDYVTLITCTPYGVNTHRLLIRGHRIENDPEEAAVTSRGLLLSPIIFAPIFIIAAVIALIAGLIFRFARRRWRRRHHKEDNRKKKKRNKGKKKQTMPEEGSEDLTGEASESSEEINSEEPDSSEKNAPEGTEQTEEKGMPNEDMPEETKEEPDVGKEDVAEELKTEKVEEPEASDKVAPEEEGQL